MHAGHRSLYYVYKMLLSILVTLLRPTARREPVIDTRTRLIADRRQPALLLLADRRARAAPAAEGGVLVPVGRHRVRAARARVWYDLLRGSRTRSAASRSSSTLFFFGLLFVLLHAAALLGARERAGAAADGAGAGDRPAGRRAARRSPTASRRGARNCCVSRRPRVAVIVPCYNDGALAEEAVGLGQEAGAGRGRGRRRRLDRGGDARAPGRAQARRHAGGAAPERRPRRGADHRTCRDPAPLVFPLDADDRLEPGALAAHGGRPRCAARASASYGATTCSSVSRGAATAHRSEWLPWTLTYVNPYPVSSMFRRERAGARRGLGGARLRGLGPVAAPRRARGWRERASIGSSIAAGCTATGGCSCGAPPPPAALRGASAAQRDVFARRAELRVRERPRPGSALVYPVLFGPRKVVPVRVEAFLQRAMMRLGTGLPG